MAGRAVPPRRESGKARSSRRPSQDRSLRALGGPRVHSADERSDSRGFLVDRVARGRSQRRATRIVSGTSGLSTQPVAGKLPRRCGSPVSLVTAGSGFLDLWSRYGAMEVKALRRARRAGWLKYDHAELSLHGRLYRSLANDCTLMTADQFKRTSPSKGAQRRSRQRVPEIAHARDVMGRVRASLAEDARSPATFEDAWNSPARSAPSRCSSGGSDEGTRRTPAHCGRFASGDKTRLKRRAEAESHPKHAARCHNSACCSRSARENASSRGDRCRDAQREAKVFRRRVAYANWRRRFGSPAEPTPDIALIRPRAPKTTVIVALVETPASKRSGTRRTASGPSTAQQPARRGRTRSSA